MSPDDMATKAKDKIQAEGSPALLKPIAGGPDVPLWAFELGARNSWKEETAAIKRARKYLCPGSPEIKPGDSLEVDGLTLTVSAVDPFKFGGVLITQDVETQG